MYKMSLKQIIRITEGTLVRKGSYHRPVRAVSTDSREIVPGSLFIALKGPNFDGHDYITQAILKGACAVCVSDPAKLPDGDYTAISVEDTLKAYQSIAKAVREEQGFIVVGVTGSVGKTSTREMIAAAISPGIGTYQTRENFNNEIGLPKTLIETPDDAQVCITEMGMRAKGEIRELTLIARPDIAIITNIGIAHIGRLGSRDEIFSAKTEILDGLKEDGLVILNINDKYLYDYCTAISPELRTCAVYTGEEIPIEAEFTVRGYDIVQTPLSVSFQVVIKSYMGIPVVLKDVTITIPGAHNVMNALIGIAVATELDLKLSDVVKGISKYESTGNRQKIITHGSFTIIDDTYNAGPESMISAIKMLKDIADGRRKIAVLGGMLELGDYSPLAHEEVGRECVLQEIDVVFALGRDAGSVKKGIDDALFGQSGDHCISFYTSGSRDELTDELIQITQAGDVILIKGSRGYEMEKVTQALLEMDVTGVPVFGGDEQ
ncbi:MAG: UDP-N-acetylmuramoyl-tripeptide--D-alanyl-D-alanine ligase [Saccharofermentanales bacterium]